MSTNQNVESLNRRIEELSPVRRALLDKLLKAKGVGTTPKTTKIQPRVKADFTPLSFAQQRMWVLYQLDPTNPSYVMPDAVRLQGKLDVTALQQGFEEIVRRHDILRTTYHMTERGPTQVVAPEHAVSEFLDFALVDYSDLPADEAEVAARNLTLKEAVTVFDLSQGKQLRIKVIRLNQEEHIILFSLHHIASDVWSLNVFANEIAVLYDAFSQGKPSPLPDPPIQYADFAVWQRDFLQGETYDKQLSYWKEHLKDAPALLELPTDRPRPAIQSFNGSSKSFVLPKTLSQQFLALTRQEDVTLFMSLLTAFYILVHRYTGEKDFVVGTPMAGRNQSETEGLIGFFINTLGLRIKMSGELSFRQLLKSVKEVVLGAHEHQDFPFEMLVEELQPERSLSYSPVFQTMFALQNVRASGGGLELPGLKLVPVLRDALVAKFDLTLFMAETNGEIDATIEYNTDLFDRSTIERMIGHLEQLLAGIIANPDQPIFELRLLSLAEEQQQISEWNQTERSFPSNACLHHLFEEQVKRTPHATALRCGSVQLSYTELDQRANQLAQYLISRGLSSESLVAVCLPRSAEMVISLLAVLKAGGAYLPLDLSSPPRRLSAILAEAQPRVLLTVSQWREQLPAGTETDVLYLDGEWDEHEWSKETVHESAPAIDPDNLAYVIYTSGSTGQPKGAMITHRGVVNYLTWCQSAYPLTEGSGAVVHSPIGFDLTVTSLYGPLVSGGCVHLLEEDEGIEGLARALEQPDQTYSLIKLTPAHLEMLNQLISIESPVQTRSMVIGGEALYGHDVKSWQERAPEVRLINEYGPTETVVGCCVFEVDAESDVTPIVPIGRPIANTKLYILNEEMTVLPAGAKGELYIGGEGVGRGYMRKPEVTAQRFVPDPFSEDGGGRLYRTGDLARYRKDGQIEYLGRIDSQVKVRGYRIELGEIEAVVKTFDPVQDAIVIQKGESREEQRLVAYIVPKANSELTVAAVRDYLKSELPGYMIPSAIMLIDALPLTQNGKIDYRELPEWDAEKAPVRTTFVAPRNIVELEVAEIWQEVLNIPRIGATDNFFELGGHSMLGMRVSARIFEKFGYEVPLSVFFEGGTVEHVASLIRNKINTSQSHLATLQSEGSQPPIFFVHPIGGGIVCYVYLARYLGTDQPVYVFQALEKDDPHKQVETMATAYIDAMREVQPNGPYRIGGWSFGSYVAHEMACQLKQAGEEVELLAILDNGSPGLIDQAAEDDPASGKDPVALARILENFANLKEPLPIDEDYLRQLGPDEQLLYIMEQAKKARIMPQELTLHQVKRSLQNFKSRVEAARSYVAPVYPGKITLFKAVESTPWDQDFLATDPTWGWGQISTEPVEMHSVPGSHETVMAEPAVIDLAAKLKDVIARIERK